MEFLIGFLIALVIGLTGVGGGTVTAPVLILFLGLPGAEAVGTALIFGAAVKTLAVPVYLWRKEVDFRALAYLLAGGIPGVLLGSLVLNRLRTGENDAIVLTVVGAIVVLSAGLTLSRFLFRDTTREVPTNRYGLLAFCATLIGAEVGFSSAGAGALGTIALLQLTALSAAQVVGTDLAFGFVVALAGGGIHFAQGLFQYAVALKLIAGGICGVMIGAYLAGVLPKRTLRLALSAWLVWLGLQLCYRGLAVLAHG